MLLNRAAARATLPAHVKGAAPGLRRPNEAHYRQGCHHKSRYTARPPTQCPYRLPITDDTTITCDPVPLEIEAGPQPPQETKRHHAQRRCANRHRNGLRLGREISRTTAGRAGFRQEGRTGSRDGKSEGQPKSFTVACIGRVFTLCVALHEMWRLSDQFGPKELTSQRPR